ncbi:MAG: phospho-N-acetylmuramoyl-pentapeptide-transferase [Elusimicrobia bacterium]|jgi:phospho-N-acetylmuramoyl-pentapeptide-transferase|nr:phospho-N-acetylmuramoyl-pentapeptide-transferase [Elusimicrobiota bacterium]
MLYHMLYGLKEVFSPFNVVQYITFRTAAAFITALLINFLIAPKIIRFLIKKKKLQVIREDGPSTHFKKEGTPTMGGIIIIFSLLFSVSMWGRLNNRFILILIAATVCLGLLGFLDDYISVYKKKSEGLSPAFKLGWQLVFALGIAVYFYFFPTFDSQPYSVILPFLKNTFINLGSVYILFVILTVIATSNAVNITDGLDGLAIGGIIFAAITYAVLAYIAGNVEFSSYLFLPYVKGAGEITVFLAALAGAGFGFLWYNIFPARVFMGDTASLFMGGVIGITAIIIKQEILQLVVGGVFLAEIVSVALQVIYFRIKGKRLFKMAPLHHHFELKGWSEPQIVIRFWIIAIMLAFAALATLKLR